MTLTLIVTFCYASTLELSVRITRYTPIQIAENEHFKGIIAKHIQLPLLKHVSTHSKRPSIYLILKSR